MKRIEGMDIQDCIGSIVWGLRELSIFWHNEINNEKNLNDTYALQAMSIIIRIYDVWK